MKNKADLISEIQGLKKFETRPIAIERGGQFQIDQKARGVVIENENDILAVVSPKYKLVQFDSVFLPLIQNIPDLEGHIATYRGKAQLFVFPHGEAFEGEQNTRIGVKVSNSIDKSSAIRIGFSVMLNGYLIPVKAEPKEYRQIHAGKVIELNSSFLQAIGEVKNSWKLLVEKYKEFAIDTETKESIYKELKLTKKAREKINEKDIKNLWELFMETLAGISSRKFRSDIHRQKKIDKIVGIFSSWSIGVSL
jgi:hypothetical protein